MIEAFLQGKLTREQENLEDLLTSLVFGTFRRSSDPNAVVRFLALANPFPGHRNLLCEHRGLAKADFDDYTFWPQWRRFNNVRFAEPDLELIVDAANGKRFRVVIEAKYKSGKSSEDEGLDDVSDQLAKQWAHLEKLSADNGQIPLLIYLTADYAMPLQAIKDSMSALQRNYSSLNSSEINICWLSWRVLFDAMSDPVLFDGRDERLWKELHCVVDHLGLYWFRGIGDFKGLPAMNYRFSRSINWEFGSIRKISWGFQASG
jgi:hypothetical protein